MISKATAASLADHMHRWCVKHRISDEQIEELLRWMRKVEGNESFRSSMEMLYLHYLQTYDIADADEMN